MSFTNTYKLYKIYTNDVCQWLLSTSGLHFEQPEVKEVTPVPIPASANPPKGNTGRLKGKARKTMKNQSKNNNGPIRPPVGNKKSSSKSTKTPVAPISLAVDQLVTMAEAIASDSLKMATVPHSVVNKLEKCIKLRQEYLSLYETKTDETSGKAVEDLKRENSQHAYFVRILQHVLSILRPEASTEELADKEIPNAENTQTKPLEDGMCGLKNFGLLSVADIESDDEEDSLQTSVTIPRNPPADQSGKMPFDPSSEKRYRQEFEDYTFAIFCLFTDFNRLKELCQSHWTAYKAGEISLETVTLMTNMSIAAMRQCEQTFMKTFADFLPKDCDYWDIVSDLYDEIGLQRGIAVGDICDKAHELDGGMKDIGDLICYNAMGALMPVVELLAQSDNNIPVVTHLGKVYDRSADRTKMTSEKIREQDMMLLFSLITDLSILKRAKNQIIPLDDFTIAMHSLMDDGPISVWVVFATQIFLDINAVLNVEAGKALDELQGAAQHAYSTLEALDATHLKELSCDTFKDYTKVRDAYMFVIKRTILEDEMKMYSRKRMATELSSPFKMLKQHPLLCGTRLLSLRLWMHQIGTHAGKFNDYFLYSAHAYHTFRSQAGLDVEWPDMEYYIKYHGEDDVFAGRVPETLEESLKSFSLANGMKIKLEGGKLEWRPVGGPSRARDRLANSQVLEVILDWGAEDKTKGDTITARMLTKLMALKHTTGASRKRSSNMDLATQILAVKDLVEEHIPYLRFDLLTLYAISRELFVDMCSKLDPYFQDQLGKSYVIRKHQPQEIITTMLRFSNVENSTHQSIYMPDLPSYSSYSINIGSLVLRKILMDWKVGKITGPINDFCPVSIPIPCQTFYYGQGPHRSKKGAAPTPPDDRVISTVDFQERINRNLKKKK